MLIGLFGYLDGYNGTFLFDVGKAYEDVPYMGMRIVSASLIQSIRLCVLRVNLDNTGMRMYGSFSSPAVIPYRLAHDVISSGRCVHLPLSHLW